MGLREEKKTRQRGDILRVAIDMFRKRGYERTRVQDIVARLQISEGTFFNYFASKDALLHEFVLGEIDRQAAMLRRTLADSNRSARSRIRMAVNRVARAWSYDRDLMAVALVRPNLVRATGQLKARELRNYALLADLFEEGQRRGEFRRDIAPMQLAEIITAIYSLTGGNWVIGWWKDRGEKLETRLMRAVDVFLDGCTVQAGKRNASRAASDRNHHPTSAEVLR